MHIPNPPENEFGDMVEVFQPIKATLIAGAIIVVLLVLAGAALLGFPLNATLESGGNLPWFAKKGWCWMAVILSCVLGVVFVAGGVGLAFYVNRLRSRRVEVFTHGLCLHERHGVEELPWSEIDSIQEIRLFVHLPIVKGPARKLMPEVSSTSYTIKTVSGKEHIFTADSVQRIRHFGELLKGLAEALGLPWETVEEHEDSPPVRVVDRANDEATPGTSPATWLRWTQTFFYVIGSVLLVILILAVPTLVKMGMDHFADDMKQRKELQQNIQKDVERVQQGEGGEAIRRLMGADQPPAAKK